jgi:predicted MFS family arabinose efflux permease
MKKMERKLQSENTNINFGKAGWGIVIYCLAMFFLLIGYSIDGMNIVAPAFAEKTGIEYSNVLSVTTIAGLIGVVAYVLGGRLIGKIGPRYISGICLLCAGAAYIYWGNTDTLVSYTVGLSLVTIFINIAAYLAGGSLVAQWFPKKKGLVNGFTTMGHNLGSAF